VGYVELASSDHPPIERRYLAPRLALNIPAIHWEGAARESLDGIQRSSKLDDFLQSTRSDLGNYLRLTDPEVFRVLYAEARQKNWDVHPSNLLHMARTARHAGMSSFAESAIKTYLDCSFYPEERAWAHSLQGEHLEARDLLAQASDRYELALAEHPGCKSALRLSHSRFLERKWQASLDAYQLAIERRNAVELVDDGAPTIDGGLICAAASLHELGRAAEARAACRELRRMFPESETIAKMCQIIE
jgi:tetratricopeptide (TPR) repeat protein